MIWQSLSKYQDEALLITRLGFGLTFVYFHGWEKLMGGPEYWQAVGEAMGYLGISFGHTFFGFLGSFAESIGSICIALGLFFRPVCAMLGFTMLIASFSHFASGDGSPSHAMQNLSILIGLLAIGPGKYSLDALLRKKSTSGRS